MVNNPTNYSFSTGNVALSKTVTQFNTPPPLRGFFILSLYVYIVLCIAIALYMIMQINVGSNQYYCEQSSLCSLKYTPPPLPTSVQPISITKTLLIVTTKNERDPPLFTGKLLIKFQNILRNTTQVIILFSVISSPITLERQKRKSSKMKGILLSSPVSC